MTLEDGHWATISIWQKLQYLVNDLVFYESQGVGCNPSNPNMGADAGWDGKFSGVLYGNDGVHSLQSKHTNKNYQPATTYLKGQIPGEVDKAIAAGAQHLVIATNANLSIPQVEALEGIDKKTLISLSVWSRAKITQCIERHPGLLAQHFGIGQITLLRIPSEHFAKNESALCDDCLQHESVARIVESATQSFGAVHVIHGIGGTGKSHVLRLIAHRLVALPNTIVRVVSRCRGASLIEDVSTDLLMDATSRIALLLDDAERQPGSLLEQMATLVRTDYRFHIIITCRSVAVESCQTRMGLAELSVPYAIHEVPALSEGDLLAFVRRYAPTRCPEDHEIRSAIRQFRSIPYLLKLWAEANESGGLSQEQIRSVFTTIVSKCLRSCRPALEGLIPEPKQSRVLGAIAAATPFAHDDFAAMNAIALVSVCPIGDVSLAIGKLEQGNVLRRVGNRLRFNPDTIGDLLFAQEMKDGGFQRLVIEHCLPLNPAGLIASVAAAGNWGDSTTAGHVAASVLNSWRGDQDASMWWSAQDRFRQVAQLCLLAPAEALCLIRAHLELSGCLYRPGDDEGRRNLLGAFRNVEDTLRILGRHGLQREGIIGLIVEVAAQFEVSARKPLKDLVAQLFRPLRGPATLMSEDLRRLSLGLMPGHEGDLSAWVAVTACCEVLASAHEDNFSDGLSYTIRARALANTDVVRELRQSAMNLLAALVENRRFQDAISIAESIGESSGMPPIGDVDALPLGHLFRQECDAFLSLLDLSDFSQWSLAELYCLDQLALSWWSHRKSEIVSERILARISRTPTYRLFIRLATHMPIDDFATVADAAPSDGRWSWLVEHFSMRGATPDPEDERVQGGLADLMTADFAHPQEVVVVLVLISESIAKIHSTAWGDQTLSMWVKRAPECFDAASRLADWPRVNQGLRQTVDSTLAISHPTAFSASTQAVIDSHGLNVDAIDRFLRGMVAASPSLEPLAPVLLMIAKNRSARVRSGLLISCWQSGLASIPNLRDELILTCLDVGYDRSILSPISWLFQIRGNGDFDPLPADMWLKVITGIACEENLTHDDGHFFATATGKSPDSYIDLVQRRILHSREVALADDDARLKPFPSAWSGWVDLHKWNSASVNAYLGMLAKHRDALGEWWQLHDALDVFELHDALPEVFVDVLVRDIEGPDTVRASVAREILLHTNSGRSIAAKHIRSVCRILVNRGERERVAQWLYGWDCGRCGSVGSDGVCETLIMAIYLLTKLKNEESDVVLKALFSEVLANHERQRDQIRQQRQQNDSAD